MWLLWLLGVAAIVLVGVWAHNSQKAAAAKRREVLAAAAEEFMLESAIDPETATVTGRVDGYEVTFRLVTRGSGSNAESWTECEVRVDTHELDIALRPQTRREERWVEEGLARDVIVGNDEFDDKFIVEVAPEQLAIDALDELICAELLAHHPVEVKRTSDGLMFEKVGWLEEPEQIRRFGKMAALLAGNMGRPAAAMTLVLASPVFSTSRIGATHSDRPMWLSTLTARCRWALATTAFTCAAVSWCRPVASASRS